MSNIEKTAEIIYTALSGQYGDFRVPHDAAQALADAGLLAPEPPKTEIINADVLSWHYGQITLKNGGIAVDRSVDEFESEEWFSLDGARKYALALLAAATYAEEIGK